ncbi:MAG: EamA family transporter [Eubacteriales bacterium]|nr:EamA family transporter [Eubacteriales bacterium]MDD3882347.1 EamA family transporter [Eubacteriales bacterium]MDD4512432.1 EamA family transporter [Eubacteriales bacterium]
MWFVYALITTCAWGAADLFYKKGADETDKYSHLKTSMMVGFVMGLHAVFTLITTGISYNPMNLLAYLPVSLMYILSMTIGYFGLRYLALSISSPIQNSSGALTCILCLIFLGKTLDLLSSIGVVLICAGVLALDLIERASDNRIVLAEDKKYSRSVTAILMPIAYCVVDALGTFFDAYYLDDFSATPLIGVTEETLENVANMSYEFTFLITAILIFIFLKFIRKQKIGMKLQGSRGLAAVCETAGQATYVFAMSGNSAVAAPMIASYCIVSLILSRIFLKETLTKKQWIVISAVIIGIALMGISEGLSE